MSKHIKKAEIARLKTFPLTIIIMMLGFSSAAASPSFVPRRTPEFRIAESSGKSTLLSALRGRVVVMEFFFLQSNHCTRVAKMLNKLNLELGPRGFQALGIVFDPPNAPESHGALVGPAVSFFKLTYPVGFSSKADVDSYLGRQRNQVLNIPQIVVIDRAGMIRATSGPTGGDPQLENEDSLRQLIEELLNEVRH